MAKNKPAEAGSESVGLPDVYYALAALAVPPLLVIPYAYVPAPYRELEIVSQCFWLGDLLIGVFFLFLLPQSLLWRIFLAIIYIPPMVCFLALLDLSLWYESGHYL